MVEFLFDDNQTEDQSWRKPWLQPINKKEHQHGEEDICS
jgi:hypothetical protein